MIAKFTAALAAGAASLALCVGPAAAAASNGTPKTVYFIFTPARLYLGASATPTPLSTNCSVKIFR